MICFTFEGAAHPRDYRAYNLSSVATCNCVICFSFERARRGPALLMEGSVCFLREQVETDGALSLRASRNYPVSLECLFMFLPFFFRRIPQQYLGEAMACCHIMFSLYNIPAALSLGHGMLPHSVAPCLPTALGLRHGMFFSPS